MVLSSLIVAVGFPGVGGLGTVIGLLYACCVIVGEAEVGVAECQVIAMASISRALKRRVAPRMRFFLRPGECGASIGGRSAPLSAGVSLSARMPGESRADSDACCARTPVLALTGGKGLDR